MEYRLFAADKEWSPRPAEAPAAAKAARRGAKAGAKKKKRPGRPPGPVADKANYAWSTDVPILVRAMALAGRTLFVAGPDDVLDESALGKTPPGKERLILKQEAALAGEAGAVLRAVSADNGKKLAEYRLDAPPVFDGMAAAGGRIYLTTTDGKLQCFAAK